MQPAPALVNTVLRVHVERIENLKEPLCPTFQIDQGAVCLCEACSRQTEFGSLPGTGTLVIQHNQGSHNLQSCFNVRFRKPGVQIVFQDDEGVCVACDSLI